MVVSALRSEGLGRHGRDTCLPSEQEKNFSFERAGEILPCRSSFRSLQQQDASEASPWGRQSTPKVVHTHRPRVRENHPWRLLVLLHSCLQAWHQGNNRSSCQVHCLKTVLLSHWVPRQPPLGSGDFLNLLASSSPDSSLAEQKSLITSWSEDLSNSFSCHEDEVQALDLGSKAKPERSHGCPPAHLSPAGALSTTAAIMIRKGVDKGYRSVLGSWGCQK